MFELLPLEKEALLEALRRDLRSEGNLAMRDPGWATWHQRNVQLNVRLLEALNPKRQDFAKLVSKDFLTGGALPKSIKTVCTTSAEMPSANFISKDFC